MRTTPEIHTPLLSLVPINTLFIIRGFSSGKYKRVSMFCFIELHRSESFCCHFVWLIKYRHAHTWILCCLHQMRWISKNPKVSTWWVKNNCTVHNSIIISVIHFLVHPINLSIRRNSISNSCNNFNLHVNSNIATVSQNVGMTWYPVTPLVPKKPS